MPDIKIGGPKTAPKIQPPDHATATQPGPQGGSDGNGGSYKPPTTPEIA